MSCLMAESKIAIYFLKMSFWKLSFARIAFVFNEKAFVTFTCTFRKVREDIHK